MWVGSIAALATYSALDYSPQDVAKVAPRHDRLMKMQQCPGIYRLGAVQLTARFSELPMPRGDHGTHQQSSMRALPVARPH
jgi:hypothetical protein